MAGLEKALREEGEAEVELAVRRLLVLYGVALSIGGIPLLHLGDELGRRNGYGYRDDPAAIEGRVFGGLRRLIAVRRAHQVFAGGDTEILDPGNDGVFGYVRRQGGQRMLALANFTEREQREAGNEVRRRGLEYRFRDLITDKTVTLDEELTLEPYRLVWLVAEETTDG